MILALQELAPLLKYVRGDVLSPEHWMELFHLVGLPRGTSLDKLSRATLFFLLPIDR